MLENRNEKNSRNPNWTRDELILALNLYFRHNPTKITEKHDEVIKLSKILRSLPIHDNSLKGDNFRNTNSVYSKLGNFLWIDPNPLYTGKGRKNGSALDKIVWNDFINDKNKLQNLAHSILISINFDKSFVSQSINYEEEEFPEGKILYRVHKCHERNSVLVKKKKQNAMDNNKLICEICAFDFYEIYGELGEGYIECHHTVPVSEYKDNTTTKLNDLVLVCSNCHKMLHRKRPWLKKEQLIKILNDLQKNTD